jgi:hypothetical protein
LYFFFPLLFCHLPPLWVSIDLVLLVAQSQRGAG